MKIGIIKERKSPPDTRVALTPAHCKQIMAAYPNVQISVESSDNRCFSDNEYKNHGISVVDDVSDCEILIGVKEVPIANLVPNKHYFFFSHTIKEQVYNRALLKAIIDKNIKLTDYEVITDDSGARLIAFGKYAGMVGAHNAIYTWQSRQGRLDIKRMHEYRAYTDAQAAYKKLSLDPIKIVLTGTGRVSNGAAEVLRDMGIKQVAPLDYVLKKYDEAVFTQLNCFYYVKRKDGRAFDKLSDFYDHPKDYESDFSHCLPISDIMINGIYWDNSAPAFFTKEQMKSDDFNIKVISDVTCDIAPIASIPSTLRASTIADPIFGYDPQKESEVAPHQDTVIDMTTIDNLPNEMPRDASQAFGDMFCEHVIPELFKPESQIMERATLTEKGDLSPTFEYLRDYLNG